MRKRLFLLTALVLLLLGIPGGLWVREALRGRAVGQGWTRSLLAPPVRVLSGGAALITHSLEYLVTSGQVRRENENMRQRVALLETENSLLREAITRYRHLDAALEMAEAHDWKTVQADVVAYGGRRWSRSVVINRGRQDKIEVGDPVLQQNGLAGVVVEVSRWTATVQLLTDPRSAVGVTVLPTRSRGILAGTGDSDKLQVTLEDPQEEIQPGQRLITTGMVNSLYPRGLPAGTVSGLRKNLFGQTVGEVQPPADFDGLTEVLVLKTGRKALPSVDALAEEGDGDSSGDDGPEPAPPAAELGVSVSDDFSSLTLLIQDGWTSPGASRPMEELP